MLGPGDNGHFREVRAVDLNLSGRCEKSAVFYGICREFVQQQGRLISPIPKPRSRNRDRKSTGVSLINVRHRNRLYERAKRPS